MKRIFGLYSSFNIWANTLMIDAVAKLNEVQTKTILKSSFPSIHATLVHMHNAETTWMNRVQKFNEPEIPVTDTSEDTAYISALLLKRSVAWKDFISGSDEHQLQKTISYKNTRGVEFNEPLYEIIMQVMNHATYHRGQLVTMMRELGVSELPRTDFIEYVRNFKDQ